MYTFKTSKVVRCLILWIVSIGMSWFVLTVAFANDSKRLEIDSLKQILSNQSDPVILIPVLGRLAHLYSFQPERVIYLKQQYALASRIESTPDIYKSLGHLVNYYYNCVTQQDSLLYWGAIIDSMAHSRNEYPDELMASKAMYCKNLIWNKDYETAMTKTLELYGLSSEHQQIYGLILSAECLGVVYRSVNRDSDAVEAYQEGLDLLSGADVRGKKLAMSVGDKLDIQLRMISLQLESCFRVHQFARAERIAANYLKLIKQQEELNETQSEFYPVNREYWLFYSLCVDMYVRENKLDEAKEALDKAIPYLGNVFADGDYVELVYLFSKATYYKAVGDLSKALSAINEILEVERIPDELQLKADILKQQGKSDEVLLLYDEIYEFDQRKNNETFLRQINQLRTLHEINAQEEQKRELAYNAQKMEHKQDQLLFSLGVVVVLLLILYILYIYVRRLQRLKNELLHEKESLLESEQKLIRERDKAEEASRMKSTFVANMSHEIRTPLNAIVGFSGLLIDDSADPDEKEEYSRVIKNNTDLMLNLINDVLDMSRMETGDINFKMDHYSLYDCCQKALDSVRYLVPISVMLTFSPDNQPVRLYTDNLRLQQLLTNLLTNACKFTSEGTIDLSYRIEKGGDQVRIAVTDTGSGVPLEKQATIFKRFEKLDDYKSGVGLGLSICTLIADRLQSSIFIDSTYTRGARFVFIHPCEIPS